MITAAATTHRELTSQKIDYERHILVVYSIPDVKSR